MGIVAIAMAVAGFIGGRRELREAPQEDEALASPTRSAIAVRAEIKVQPQPKGFSGIPERVKKRTG